jgi:hypothetical protein
VRVFGRNVLHSRIPLVPTPARLKLLHACYQWHSSRVSTFLTSSHCKLRPNTKGIHRRHPRLWNEGHHRLPGAALPSDAHTASTVTSRSLGQRLTAPPPPPITLTL